MKKIEKISKVLKRVKIMNFIKSIALGVVFVEEGLVPLLTIRHRNIFVQGNLIQDRIRGRFESSLSPPF